MRRFVISANVKTKRYIPYSDVKYGSNDFEDVMAMTIRLISSKLTIMVEIKCTTILTLRLAGATRMVKTILSTLAIDEDFLDEGSITLEEINAERS